MVITFLTGSRPVLLRQTLKSFFEHYKDYSNDKIYILINGNDQPTHNLLFKEFLNYPLEVITTPKLLPIGRAISMLAKVAEHSGEKYWCHIEDDWRCVDNNMQTAIDILEKNKDISQVRLRHIDERVLHKHMITGMPIVWQRNNGWFKAKAHMTFNPNIIRTADISKPFPCSGERNAQKNWLDNDYIAQIDGGMFKHIGDNDSLRLKTKCEV